MKICYIDYMIVAQCTLKYECIQIQRGELNSKKQNMLLNDMK